METNDTIIGKCNNCGRRYTKAVFLAIDSVIGCGKCEKLDFTIRKKYQHEVNKFAIRKKQELETMRPKTIYLNKGGSTMAKKVDKKAEKKRYVIAAKDLNKTLGLDPAIDTKEDLASLKQRIKDESVHVDRNDDLKDSTWELLEELGVNPKNKKKKGKESSKKDDGKKGKKTKTADKKEKADKTADKKKKGKAAAKKSSGPSNKEVVWNLWKKGKGMTDPEAIYKKIKGAVKFNTIRTWLSAWKRGNKNFYPSCAKK